MKIDGKIEGSIIINRDSVIYCIKEEKKEYRVLSVNRQAIKDAIFLRQGQRISIEGNVKNNTILVKESKIDIKNLGEKRNEDITGIDKKD